jgi:spermidine synthase
MQLSDTRLAALFLVSAAVLGFEIEVMRVFAVASWSNFGSMVISIALLGFGLAGTLLTLLQARVRRSPDAWICSSAFALAPSMALAHALAQQVPFNPVLIATDPAQIWWIGVFYLVYGLPFFVGGLFIGAMFTILSSRTHALYFWNMLGSGLGGLMALGLMFLFPPDFLVYPLVGIALLPALLCTVHWDSAADRFSARSVEVLLCILMCASSIFLLARFGNVRVSDFKPESYARDYPDSELLYHVFSPLGESRVYGSSYFHFAPGLSDNAGVSLPHMPRNAFLGLFVDGNGPVGIMRKLAADEEGYVDFLPMSAPYHVLSKPRVLLLRLGGGAGIQTALHNGAGSVWVVESNPDLLHMLRDVPFFRNYTGGVLLDTRVHLVTSEVRAFTAATRERFDLVEIGLIDSIGLSQAGGYSVEENYTYTVEALRDYLKCLTPSGILSITVWDRLSPPRNVPRLFSTVVEALRRQGDPRPENRLFAFNLLLSTATVLVKNGDFTAAEIAKLREYCRRMSFEVDYAPGINASPPADFQKILQAYRALYALPGNPSPSDAASADIPLIPSVLYRDSLQWLFEGRQNDLYAGYVFDIQPATDDKPYYSGYLKPASLPSFAAKAGEIPEEWGYILLLATFGQSLLFAILVALVPIGARFRELFRKRRGTPGVVLYYACLGLGYMMAEIYLIQKFVFYLGDPVYSNSIVITILLISSGFGSLAAGGARSPRARVLAASLGIVALAVFFRFGMPAFLGKTLGLPLTIRALISVLLIAPLGFLLGIPFPSGLALLSRSREGLVPWAWGVNAALSVSGAVLTRILSTSMGFTTVLAVMAALYLAAGLLFRVNGSPQEASATARI